MTRVKGGTIHQRNRKKVLKQAKGYFGSKHRLYKTAKEQVMHSLKYSYRDRRQKKRDFRKLWITRINAACRMNGISYSKFMNGLNKAEIEINRKMLSEMAIIDAEGFSKLVEIAKDALEGKIAKEEVSKKEEKKANEEKVENNDDLSKKTVAELRKLAEDKKIEGAAKMKKKELIDALK